MKTLMTNMLWTRMSNSEAIEYYFPYINFTGRSPDSHIRITKYIFR